MWPRMCPGTGLANSRMGWASGFVVWDLGSRTSVVSSRASDLVSCHCIMLAGTLISIGDLDLQEWHDKAPSSAIYILQPKWQRPLKLPQKFLDYPSAEQVVHVGKDIEKQNFEFFDFSGLGFPLRRPMGGRKRNEELRSALNINGVRDIKLTILSRLPKCIFAKSKMHPDYNCL